MCRIRSDHGAGDFGFAQLLVDPGKKNEEEDDEKKTRTLGTVASANKFKETTFDKSPSENQVLAEQTKREKLGPISRAQISEETPNLIALLGWLAGGSELFLLSTTRTQQRCWRQDTHVELLPWLLVWPRLKRGAMCRWKML